jgi:hypothetical protein
VNEFNERKVVKCLYRCMSVNWIDIDEESNSICKCDYSAVSGFDSKKYSDLYVMCLQKPSQTDMIQKVIIICLCVILVLCLAIIVQNYYEGTVLTSVKTLIGETCKGSVIPVVSN